MKKKTFFCSIIICIHNYGYTKCVGVWVLRMRWNKILYFVVRINSFFAERGRQKQSFDGFMTIVSQVNWLFWSESNADGLRHQRQVPCTVMCSHRTLLFHLGISNNPHSNYLLFSQNRFCFWWKFRLSFFSLFFCSPLDLPFNLVRCRQNMRWITMSDFSRISRKLTRQTNN